MAAISPGLWMASECSGGTGVRRKRLVSRQTVTAFAAGALLSAALAAAAWALLSTPTAPTGAHPEPAARKTYSTELPREWRWTPKGVEFEHMYGRRH